MSTGRLTCCRRSPTPESKSDWQVSFLVILPTCHPTYSREFDVPQCHFSTVKVEEVHQLDSTAFAQRLVINSFRLVIELQRHREDFDALCGNYQLPGKHMFNLSRRTEEDLVLGRWWICRRGARIHGCREGSERLQEV